MKHKMANHLFRKAAISERDQIWEILKQGIERRRNDGSNQWQDGYPNPDSVKSDIEKGFAYVLEIDHKIAAYAAVINEPEPAYEEIEGKWLLDGDYIVVHRVAVSDEFLGQGLAHKVFREIESIAKDQKIMSIKVDTNFDNTAMLKILEKLGYVYCGEVYFRGSARKAFQKVLD